MKNDKEHLNIDLEFLDKKEPPKVAPKQHEATGQTPHHSTPVSTGYKYNWKNILIIGGVVLFIGWAMFSNSDSSSSPTTSNSPYTPSAQTTNSNSDDTVIRGQYRCSSYNASQADALAPSESESTISSAQNALEQRSTYLENLKSEIDGSYVNEYSSQYEIDNYNQKVDDYNSELASYKRDASSMSSRIDRFNSQVEAHNNYLINHCTKAY